jgi:hypothetical protein
MQFVATGYYYKRIKFMAFPALAILLNMLRCLSEDSSFIAPSCWKVQVVMHFPLLNLYPQSAPVPFLVGSTTFRTSYAAVNTLPFESALSS